MYRILVTDPLEATGLELLRSSGHEVIELAEEDRDQLVELIADVDALVVRSGTQVTAQLLERAKRLRVVGRAGIGVDNVDVEAATSRGILVVNAPTANLLSATEHTFALMLSLARNVTKADRDIKSGRWNRKLFVGAELQGKTLGIVGFGRIGQQVGLRAAAFDMKLLAYDPFLDADVIRRHNAEPSTIEEVLRGADVVTLHVPLTDGTRNFLDADRISMMKPGALLVNCARGGVVDEQALLAALDSGALAGAAVDVFANEPLTDFSLAGHPNVVATPHLGAQTREAQVRISTQTANMVLAALDGSLAITAVNLPFRPAGAAGEPFLALAEKLGVVTGSLLDGGVSRVAIELRGVEENLHAPMTVAALKGALARSVGESINYVNAERIAAGREIDLVRSTAAELGDYPNQVRVEISGEQGRVAAIGTLFHDREPRVVHLAGYQLEFRPKGTLLVIRNVDIPGVVGKLGTALAGGGVNIAELHLSRRSGNHEALAVVRLDQPPSAEVVAALEAIDEVETVNVVDVG